MILFLLSLANAEPLMMRLERGQAAPFDGRLFNDEAVASILADSESVTQQCEIRKDLEWKTQMAELQYKYDILEAEHDALKYKHNNIVAIRDEEIEVLRKQGSTKRSTWMFLGGFALGTGASLATYHAATKIGE
tara:strand:- start:217 stop:618 length:402 start_codon:yes stop_codon:yes gene_type:complete